MKKMVHCDDFEVLKSLGTTFELDVEGVGCCCHFVLELLLYKVFCLLTLFLPAKKVTLKTRYGQNQPMHK